MDNQSLFPPPPLIDTDILDYINKGKDMLVGSWYDINKALGLLRYIKETRSKLLTSKMNLLSDLESKFEPVFDNLQDIENTLKDKITILISSDANLFAKDEIRVENGDEYFEKSLENGKIEVSLIQTIKIKSAPAQKERNKINEN